MTSKQLPIPVERIESAILLKISRLESPSYEGHTLSMLRRVAEVLGAKVRVEIEKEKHPRREEVDHESSRNKMA